MSKFKLEVRKIVVGAVEVEAGDEAAAWVAAEKLPYVSQVLGVLKDETPPPPTPTNPFGSTNPFAVNPQL